MKKLRVVAFAVAVTMAFGVFCAGFSTGPAAVFASTTRPGYSESLGWSFAPPEQPARAFTTKNISINNADLSNGTSASSFVYSSSIANWTSEGINSQSTVAGVLNTRQFSKWKTDNSLGHLSYLTETPNKHLHDHNVFVMTNRIYETTESKAGFTSETIEFEADSYYIVSVDFYAVKSFGSFYLIPTEKFDSGLDPRINLTQMVFSSGGWKDTPYVNKCDDAYCLGTCGFCGTLNVADNESAWRTAQFLVKTDELESMSFKLGLYLGSADKPSRGVIYFQSPRIEQVSRAVYNNAVYDAYLCEKCTGTTKVKCTECNGACQFDCSDCGGTGEVIGDKPCPDCSGTGEVACDVCPECLIDEDCTDPQPCPDCGGTGEITGNIECPVCNGTTKVDCDDCKGTGKIDCKDCLAKGTVANLLTQTIELDTKDIYEKNYKATDRLSLLQVDLRDPHNQSKQKEIPVEHAKNNCTNHNEEKCENRTHTQCKCDCFTFVNNAEGANGAAYEATGTFVRPSVSTSRIPGLLNFEEVDDIHLPNSSGDGSVMLLAANDGNATFRLGQPFIVKRHQIYMISYYILTADGSSCFIQLRDIRHKDENLPLHITPFDSGALNIKTESKDTVNGWVKNTVYIVGESYYDIAVDIEFWVGDENQKVTDYMLIDEFNIQRISTEYYYANQGEEGSLILDKSEPTVSISNAFFNQGTPGSVDSPYPLKANLWTTLNDGEDYVLSGVVNTEPKHWAESAFAGFYDPIKDGHSGPKPSNYGIAINPRNISGRDINNNVYMMQNKMSTWQTLSSNPFTLNTGVINVIEFDLAHQYYPGQGFSFWISVESRGRELARIDLSQKAQGAFSLVQFGWGRYAFAIKDSGLTPREVTLTFNMGSAVRLCPASVVFIDNVSVSQTDKDEDVPNNATAADLTDPKKFFVAEDPELTKVSVNNGMLEIRNREDTKQARVTNTLTESLEGGHFYEYTVRVRIDDRLDLGPSKHILQYDDDGKDITKRNRKYDCGVNFKLDGFDGGFENINNADIMSMHGLDRNGFAELVFYVRPDMQSDLALIIEFGNEYMAVTADVFISEIGLREIDEEDFREAQRAYNRAKRDNEVRGYTHVSIITESYKPPKNEPKKGSIKTDWWIIAPTLIMAVAIILAITLLLVRRFKFRVHIDKHHTSYAADDRSSRKDK